MTLEEEADAEKEAEWRRALERGNEFVIQDIEAHFAMKKRIRNRMVELSAILGSKDQVGEDAVASQLKKMFYMDKKLPSFLDENTAPKKQALPELN